MKVFISQPMRGKTTDEIRNDRDAAIKYLTDTARVEGCEIEVVNPFVQNEYGDPLELLGAAISQMADADVVYFAPGWSDARGCRVENMAAHLYDKMIIESYGRRF